jgi:5,10-methylenetetrahydrofolate reductase
MTHSRDVGRDVSRDLSMGDLLAREDRSFSFEFFPPKDEAGEEQLWRAITELEPYGPTFVSVTYGAGGTTRDRTVAITERIARETSMLPVAHLTCVGHTTAEITAIIDELDAAGVHNVMALRGDPPGGPGSPWTPTEGGLSHADELVALIRERTSMRIGVAAFPEGHVDAPDLETDARVLKAKYDAGAEFAVTDMVLRSSDYVALVERAHAVGADFPIIPGIMPILNLRSMERMVEFSRRQLPEETTARLTPYADDPAALRAEGIAIASELCEALLDAGAPGLHFYTLNRSKATREIFANLRITV